MNCGRHPTLCSILRISPPSRHQQHDQHGISVQQNSVTQFVSHFIVGTRRFSTADSALLLTEAPAFTKRLYTFSWISRNSLHLLELSSLIERSWFSKSQSRSRSSFHPIQRRQGMSCHVFPFKKQIKRQLTAAPNDSAPLKEYAGLQFGNIRASTWREGGQMDQT